MRKRIAIVALWALAVGFAPSSANAAAPASSQQSRESYVGKSVRVSGSGGESRTYLIGSPMASGLFAHGYHGVDTATKQHVALKMIKSGSHDSFDHETSILRAVKSHRFARPHGVGTTDDGRRFMVMDFARGSPLVGRDPVPQGRAVQIATQVLRAARALDRAGYRHNDLQPGNVHVHVDGNNTPTVKVIDLGAATKPGQPYRKWSTFYHPAESGANDDVYTIGALTIKMLTGAQSREALVRISDPRLRAILKKMTHPDPGHRFATPQDAIDALRPYERTAGTGLAQRREVVGAYYGTESVALANLGGLTGRADSRNVSEHTEWANHWAASTVMDDLTQKLDAQMKPGRALSNGDALARYYADVAMRANETGLVAPSHAAESKAAESPDWNVHYQWAARAPSHEVRDAIVTWFRRCDTAFRAESLRTP